MTSDSSNTENSRSQRATVSIACEIRQGTRPWKKALLEDISRTGFRIAWLPNCSQDMPLRIRIPGMELLSAWIRWQDEGAVGCEFLEHLHIAVFEHIARKALEA